MSSKADQKMVTPKRRFPEFRNSEKWKKERLGKALELTTREIEKPSQSYTGLGVRSHGKGTFLRKNEDPAKNSMTRLYQIKSEDLVVSITFAWEGAIAIAKKCDEDALVSHRFPTFTFKRKIAIPSFFQYLILDKQFIYSLGVISPGGAGRNRVLNKKDFLKLPIYLPHIDEQQKIADCLSSVDELIELEIQKLNALKDYKIGLMQELFPAEGETIPRFRFPGFSGAPKWKKQKLFSLIKTITPPRKIQTREYGKTGVYPIIDQSQNPIAGWTNDREAVIEEGRPLIIFGDHTCALKLINQPFAQGADGIKIFSGSSEIDTNYLYQYLQYKPLKMEEYKRHFSLLKEKTILYPEKETGEQETIFNCLFSVDDLIVAQQKKTESLQEHKKGLMQQLFPTAEEIV